MSMALINKFMIDISHCGRFTHIGMEMYLLNYYERHAKISHNEERKFKYPLFYYKDPA